MAAWPTYAAGAGGSANATINTSFSSGKTLSDWMEHIGATTTPGQVSLTQVVQDIHSVSSSSQSWLSFNGLTPAAIAQFTFNAPVNSANQCGRVLFNEYHVEVPVGSHSGKAFPAECSTAAMTDQEKLLEYSLFDLTNTGGQPTLSPTSVDFGSQAVGFTSASKSFPWKNNSIFTAAVTSATASGDFTVTGNTCGSVQPGASCQISAAFRPTAVGPASGTLIVLSNAATLTAALTGTGIPALTVAPAALNYPGTDAGATSTQSFTVTNAANGPVTVGTIAITGDFAETTACGTLAPGGTCTVAVGFTPSTVGTRSGTASVGGSTVALSGNGTDFTIALNPTPGTAIAGNSITTPMAVLPVSGFSSIVTLSCTTNAPGSSCTPTKSSFVPSDSAGAGIKITTIAKYNIIGYSGFGRGYTLLAAMGSGLLILVAGRKRRVVRLAVLLLASIATGSLMQGCSGKLPEQNSMYTPAGPYTYTVTATDGFLKHSATFTLNVTAD